MDHIEVVETLVTAMSGRFTYENHRELLESICTSLDVEVIHDEPGQYDPSIDGYMVLSDGNRNLRVDFMEDSYNGGQFSGCSYVEGKQKTIMVWE